MINVIDSSLPCCGCGLCAAVCPKAAIKMNMSNDGFLVPGVDEEKCTKCLMCNKVCYKNIQADPGNLNFAGKLKTSKVFAAFSNNPQTRFSSSSGGVAPEIAKYCLEHGFKIVGVHYDIRQGLAAHHIVDSPESLADLQGSKYLQSNTQTAYTELIRNKDDKFVVFGAPCQIYGIKKYIDSWGDTQRFLLIDIFCHGVPTDHLWQKYLTYVQDKYDLGEITKVNFRNKSKGWHKSSIYLEGTSGSYLRENKLDFFFDFFLSNTCLNNSCYNCRLRQDYTFSDIRLGDFWGPRFSDDENGVSIVCILTENGQRIFDEVKPNFSWEEVGYEELRKSQHNNYFKKPKEYEHVMASLRGTENIELIKKKYLKTPMRLIIKRVISIVLPKSLKKLLKNRIH